MIICSNDGTVIKDDGLPEIKHDLCPKCMTEALKRIKGYSRKIPWHHKPQMQTDF